jgi:hypothetical protein
LQFHQYLGRPLFIKTTPLAGKFSADHVKSRDGSVSEMKQTLT